MILSIIYNLGTQSILALFEWPVKNIHIWTPKLCSSRLLFFSFFTLKDTLTYFDIIIYIYITVWCDLLYLHMGVNDLVFVCEDEVAIKSTLFVTMVTCDRMSAWDKTFICDHMNPPHVSKLTIKKGVWQLWAFTVMETLLWYVTYIFHIPCSERINPFTFINIISIIYWKYFS